MDYQWVNSGLSVDYQWVISGLSVDYQWVIVDFDDISLQKYGQFIIQSLLCSSVYNTIIVMFIS